MDFGFWKRVLDLVDHLSHIIVALYWGIVIVFVNLWNYFILREVIARCTAALYSSIFIILWEKILLSETLERFSIFSGKGVLSIIIIEVIGNCSGGVKHILLIWIYRFISLSWFYRMAGRFLRHLGNMIWFCKFRHVGKWLFSGVKTL